MAANARKEKILIVISSDLFIRNYINTNALRSLENEFDCHYVGNIDISIRQDLEKKSNFHGYYEIDELTQLKHQKIFDAMMYKFRHKSKSFHFRVMRQTPYLRTIFYGPKRRFHLRLLKWVLMKPLIILKRLLLDKKFIYRQYLNFLKNSIQPNNELKKYIHQHNYDLVIFPSSAYDVDGIDLVTICNAQNLKTLFLVDNWDNLSSKSILWKKPSYIGVWGNQSKAHAIEIQGFDPTKVLLQGTPRFDQYFENRNQTIENYFDFNYILFVGTALNFDEERALQVIDEILENNKDSLNNLKLIYRPHPWRQNNCIVRESYGKNIITDPQILISSNDKSTKNQPDLDYYPSLISNAEFLVGGLTTMLIEGLIFYKQFLAIVHDDKKLVTNMRNAWDYFEHFNGLDKVHSIQFSFDENDLERALLKSWSQRRLINKVEMDNNREWYLYKDEKQYKDRLLENVKIILNH